MKFFFGLVIVSYLSAGDAGVPQVQQYNSLAACEAAKAKYERTHNTSGLSIRCRKATRIRW